MKRFLAIALMLPLFAAASAQTPSSEVDLNDLTFVRQSFVRNFYSSTRPMSVLNMEGTSLFLPNSNNIVVEQGQPELVQDGRSLHIHATEPAILRIGAFHPYLTYEARLSGISEGGSAGIVFYDNDNVRDSIMVAFSGSEVNIRVQYTGLRYHVFRLHDNGEAELLFSREKDMRNVENCVKYSFGIYVNGEAVLEKAQSMLSCGTGQADPQIVQNTDGTPLIRDGRLYVCFTTRGFERIFDSYQGVYSIGTDSFDLRLEGALFFGKGDGLIYGFHATKVVYDSKTGKYLVITTTHEDTHTLAWAETSSDILHGMHFLECHELVFPHSYTVGHGYNTEDPDFFYDSTAGKWRLAYCALKEKSYVTYLCESDNWNGPYVQLAESTKNNNTGIRIVSVGGKRHVLSGGPDTTFYIYSYPDLSYEGTFNQKYPNGGFRGWPTIVPLPYGNYERYLWITFDRGAQTGRYSYGTLYFYLGNRMWKKED